MRIKIAPSVFLLSFLLSMQEAAANTNREEVSEPLGGLWALSLEELAHVRVTSLASGTATPLDKAAAITTVITAEDIEMMGATDLDQVLETVPGLHVNRSDQAFAPKYSIRNVTSQHTPQTLVLINGVPISSLFVGNPSLVWGGMPVKTIARIEVIRGPGSALYGADAFAGVINIMTKTYQDMSGTTVGARAGSFDTQAGWIENAAVWDNGIKLGFGLEYQTTDGWRKPVDRDAQSALDELFGSNASLASQGGTVRTGFEALESRLSIVRDDLRFNLGYQGRRDLELGAGLAQALDPKGRYDSDRINTDLSYLLRDLAPGFDVEGRMSYYFATQDVASNPHLFPPGSTWPDLSSPTPGALVTFDDGVIGAPGYREEQARLDLNALYRGFDKHLIRFGAGYFYGDLYETTEQKNFDLVFTPLGLVLQPKAEGLIDVSDTREVYLPEQHRTSHHLFVQDEWQFASDWQLTSGVRYDHYSDFGTSVNPRLALVWATTDSFTTKLLYGRAFRAPTFIEAFAIANPVVLGNEALDPEVIDTYELGFSHQLLHNLRYAINLFYYEIDDLIVFVPGTTGNKAQNSGSRSAKGGEAEVEYTPGRDWRLLANFSYQKAIDDQTNQRVGEAPTNQLYGRAEWTFRPTWRLGLQANWVGKQERAPNDSRIEPVDDYHTLDLTLRTHFFDKALQAAVSIRNITDQDVFEPSPVGGLPDDFPMAGRSAYAELSYSF